MTNEHAYKQANPQKRDNREIRKQILGIIVHTPAAVESINLQLLQRGGKEYLNDSSNIIKNTWNLGFYRISIYLELKESKFSV